MAQPYIGEIRLFGGNFAPLGWALCNGQLLPIDEYDTLFNLIGTTYGGDGESSFAVPDLRGRVPVHQGTGSAGETYVMGERAGVELVTLTPSQIPNHTHAFLASGDIASSPNPANNVPGETTSTTPYFAGPPAVPLAASSVASVGGSASHENMQPFQTINYIISLFGIYPTE